MKFRGYGHPKIHIPILIMLFVVNRISSGYSALDDALQGGYPVGSVISLHGKSTRLRKYLSISFLQSNNHENEKKQLLITTREPLDKIKQEVELFGLSLDNTIYLDAVNWRNKRVNPKQESEAEFTVNNLTDLNALLAKIMEACNTYQIDKILFDSPSSLLLYSTPGKEQVYKFFELLTAFIRSHNITLCYNLEEGVHPTEVVSTMHYLSDGAIYIGEKNDDNFQNYLRIDQMSLTDFDPLPIEFPKHTSTYNY